MIEEESVDGKVHLKLEGFVSTCPFSRDRGKDHTDLQLVYTPGRSFDGSPVKIDTRKLERHLASTEGRAIPMEVVPVEVLKHCIEACVGQRLGRNAAPEEVEIRSVSASLEPVKGKDWGIATTIELRKQVARVGGRS